MSNKITDFYAAWWFLNEHPAFFHPKHPGVDYSRFSMCLDVDVQKVCPETNCIDADSTRNTLTQVWLECGPAMIDVDGDVGAPGAIVATHDTQLDCGGETFEEAILKLAELVIKYYGDPRNGSND